MASNLTPSLVVRPREHTGERDWPWVLVDETTGEVWADYPDEADASRALRSSTECSDCGAELPVVDGRCPRCWGPE